MRFAPSPNGRLHLGHALSALENEAWAQRLGGRLLVRIEDIDTVRCTGKLAQDTLDDLLWLGITWERPVRYQSEHFGDYRAASDRLDRMGLLYPCFATRNEIVAAAQADCDPDGAPLYPGLWHGASAQRIAAAKVGGQPFALRLDMERALHIAGQRGALPLTYCAMNEKGELRTIEARPRRWGDVVIVRKDTPTSYHLAVVVDDALQGVTHVVRGLDLEAATDLQRLLQVLLDLPHPIYHHHRLVTDRTGRKLSKSAGDTSLAELRDRRWTPSALRQHLGFA